MTSDTDFDALVGEVLAERPGWHGTKGGYDYHRCRCQACRAANTAYHRALRARKRECAR